jgi:hypothetical protein
LPIPTDLRNMDVTIQFVDPRSDRGLEGKLTEVTDRGVAVAVPETGGPNERVHFYPWHLIFWIAPK